MTASDGREAMAAAASRGWPSEPAVVMAGVRRAFPGRGPARREIAAVDGVDLVIRPGEAVGLVGPSGAGKSTLARMILGLEPPDSGRVRLFGVDLGAVSGSDRRAVLRRVGVVFQDPYAALSPSLTVLDIVLEPLLVHRSPMTSARTRAIEALEAVGLADPRFRRRLPDQLSGGERQRAGLARAIALRPELLIADEPTSMLDASRQLEFVELVRDLRSRYGLTLLFVTHDLALAAAACDRLVVLDAGRVVEDGPVTGIVAEPRAAVTKSLVAAVRARTSSLASAGTRHAG